MQAAVPADVMVLAAIDVPLVVILVAGVILFGAIMQLVRVRRQDRQEEYTLPPLIVDVRARPPGPATDGASRPAHSDVMAPGPAAPAAAPAASDPEAPATVTPAASAPAATAPFAPQPIVEPPELDRTLQLLPGRLEPATPGAGQEIRFVRVPGVSRFTFGRSPGEPPLHIQLSAPTASRMHAYMSFEDGRWRVGNLSHTNSVVVNGSALAGDATCVLRDGDRIEMGEVAFVFRDR